MPGCGVTRGRRVHDASDRVVAVILIARLRLIRPKAEIRVASITIIMRHYRGSGGYSLASYRGDPVRFQASPHGVCNGRSGTGTAIDKQHCVVGSDGIGIFVKSTILRE